MVENELDWQPVRIAPERSIVEAHGSTKYGPNAGEIIRVRVLVAQPWGPDPLCKTTTRYFQVHPDDARRLTGDSFLAMCEHQILAD
jgi:hypothetical protein